MDPARPAPDSHVAYVQYYYIDYELYPDDTLYFHAHWRRENPTKGRGPDLQVNSPAAHRRDCAARREGGRSWPSG
ncbi:hypothetical protein, partial [Streptomyces sp.]|uniref:hypothetical protein n=1 Tax=Streptomyces sp. TaxID=1931 RepID=UPI002F40A875